MILIFRLFILILISGLFSCNTNNNISLISFPDTLNNNKSENHIRAPGTPIFYIPPIGIESMIDTSVMDIKSDVIFIKKVIDIDHDIDHNFLKNTINNKNLSINKIQAVYAEFYLDQYYCLEMKIKNGNEKFTVDAYLDAKNIEMINAVRNSLKTIIYDKDFEINPWEMAEFSFDYKKANLNHVEQGSELYRFSSHPCPDPKKFKNGTMVSIRQSEIKNLFVIGKNSISDLYESRLDIVKRNIFLEAEIIKTSNIPPYEIIYKRFNTYGYYYDLVQELFLENDEHFFLIYSEHFDEDDELFRDLCKISRQIKIW